MTISIKRSRKIAKASLDHIDPLGSINDNSTNPSLVDELESIYQDKSSINFLDIGCSGGQFVVDMNNRSFTNYCVGIEGSDSVLNGAGSHNWNQYHNEFLFLCDATKNYSFYNSEKERILFDLIFSTEVVEHIGDIDSFFEIMYDNLKPGGMFVASIGLDPNDPRHVTIFTPEGWNEKLKKYNPEPYPFDNYLRNPEYSHHLCIRK